MFALEGCEIPHDTPQNPTCSEQSGAARLWCDAKAGCTKTCGNFNFTSQTEAEACTNCIINKTDSFCPTLECGLCNTVHMLHGAMEWEAQKCMCLGLNTTGMNSSYFPADFRKLNGSCADPRLQTDPEACPKCMKPGLRALVDSQAVCFNFSK